MEPIQSALKQWLKNKEGFQASMEEMRAKVLESDRIQQLLEKHPELTDEDISKQLMKLYEYKSASLACEKCGSLENCINVIPGYAPQARVEDRKIKLMYHECPRKEKQLKELEQQAFVKSLHMPREIHEATFSQLHLKANGRSKALTHISKFYEDSENGVVPEKGAYLHGSFGVGKTYLLAALANELAKKKVDTYFIYMPEFVREMKASISDSTINEKIDRFKRATVLILDDIGAEFLSPWFRDEVLGAILQFRMMERLPVFFTSNYSLDELESLLAKSGKGELDQLKAARIMERIEQVSVAIGVDGENFRNKS
ncbi:primosomal protein DnaI [Halalkalibacillus halophilus]|uniref:primosomal protein DnaI n=1 Tax=Halalkalibacillus halophilus TaxID=392827 RepID=UPI000404C15D|nr:primosomal protein DnaI [Halalkalibacillus halophilus]